MRVVAVRVVEAEQRLDEQPRQRQCEHGEPEVPRALPHRRILHLGDQERDGDDARARRRHDRQEDHECALVLRAHPGPRHRGVRLRDDGPRQPEVDRYAGVPRDEQRRLDRKELRRHEVDGDAGRERRAPSGGWRAAGRSMAGSLRFRDGPRVLSHAKTRRMARMPISGLVQPEREHEPRDGADGATSARPAQRCRRVDGAGGAIAAAR